MSTLVTGATGFLGRHLVRALLERGEAVRGLVRPETDAAELADWGVEVVRGDIMEPAAVAAAVHGVRRLYHLAAQVDIASPRDCGMKRVNAQGTRNVLEAAWGQRVERVVYTSTVGVIGATRDGSLLNEEHVYTGLGTELPYMRSKLLADRVAMEYARRGLPLVAVYPTLFLGPGDRRGHTTRPVRIYLEGRSLAYLHGGFGCSDVRDIAAGHVLAMERGRVGRRYILGGWNVTVREFQGLLEQVTGIAAPRLCLPPAVLYVIAIVTELIEPIRGRPPAITCGEVDQARLFWFYDYSRAREELGLACRPLVQTLRETVDWIRAGLK